MIGRRIWLSVLILGLAASLTSCSLFRKSKPVQPPPLRPIQLPPPQPPPAKTDTNLPAPPEIPTHQPETEPPVTAEQLPEPPAPPKPQQRRAARPGPAVDEPVPAEPEPPAPLIQLGEVLTPEKRAEYVRLYDQHMARTRQAVAELRGRTLNGEQSADLNRIRTFMQQAEDIVKTDPATASSLAERADTLSRALLSSVR